MSKPRAYKTAAEAITVSVLAGGGRLIAVDSSIASDGYLICDATDATVLWCADGKRWQSRVHCLQAPRLPAPAESGGVTPGKYRLMLEEADAQ